VGYRPLVYKIGEKQTANRVLLLDRDNTIVLDESGYLYEPSRLKVLPKVVEGLTFAKSLGYGIAIVTNQSGIGRGFFTALDMELFHKSLLEVISSNQELVQLIIVCPHAPDELGAPVCTCRKPNTQMIDEALEYFDAEVENTILIGDKNSDLLAAERCGVRGVNINQYSNFLDCCLDVL
jgi:D-glycero-D-manno-heptose 1,7-bisphosphate phosphatase